MAATLKSPPRKNASRLSMQALVLRFPSCAKDMSGKVWPEEIMIIRRMQLGQRLVLDRQYVEDRDSYAISWHWDVEPVRNDLRAKLSIKAWNRCCGVWMARWYPEQWDGPVTRLIGREIIKPTTCGGGYSTMEFTRRADRAFSGQNASLSHGDESER
jgi:hypothetical protein